MDHYNHEFTRQLDAIDQLTEAFLKYKIKLFESKHNEPDLRMNPTKYHILKAIYQCGSCMVVDISRQLQPVFRSYDDFAQSAGAGRADRPVSAVRKTGVPSRRR
ncbi:hypothetical protein LJK88_09520 [Paenibacillus sp. P26]|nr:hypothetical protein LJK88_09520 [Paenibacillus sp. P26]